MTSTSKFSDSRRKILESSAADSVEPSMDDAYESALSRRELKLEETFGSVKPLGPPLDVLEACRLAKEEKVARTLAEMDAQL